jgi:hypothetical protein
MPCGRHTRTRSIRWVLGFQRHNQAEITSLATLDVGSLVECLSVRASAPFTYTPGAGQVSESSVLNQAGFNAS